MTSKKCLQQNTNEKLRLTINLLDFDLYHTHFLLIRLQYFFLLANEIMLVTIKRQVCSCPQLFVIHVTDDM